MNEKSDLSELYGALSEEQEIFVMPVRMREEKLYIPSDDEEFVILVVDYFLVDHPLMLFAPKQVMEAWFFAGRVQPAQDLPIEVHVAGELVSEYGSIPIKKMKFITEDEYAEMVSEIQNGQVSAYEE